MTNDRTDSTDSSRLSPDRAFACRGPTNEVQRSILSVLSTERTPMELDTLADAISARSADGTTEDVTVEETERLSIALYHHHLPKLSDEGLIDFSPERREVVFVGAPLVDGSNGSENV